VRTLPPSFIPEKNKLASADPTVLLLEAQISGLDPIYLARNNENIVSNGNTYQAFSFELDVIQETSKGDIPNIQLRVNNVTRALEYYFDQYEGFIDSKVILSDVHVAHPNDVVIAMDADIMSSNSDDQWIYLSLGAPSPLLFRFPPETYIAEFCSWTPGGPECAKGEATNVCRRTHADCVLYQNTQRFGGHLGLANPQLRIA